MAIVLHGSNPADLTPTPASPPASTPPAAPSAADAGAAGSAAISGLSDADAPVPPALSEGVAEHVHAAAFAAAAPAFVTAPPLRLPCRRLRAGVPLPAYQTAGAAGLDLQAFPADAAPITLQPLARALVATGLAVAIPRGFEGQVRPRSGWALRHGVTVLNSPGTIDSDYRGEVAVLLINLGQGPVTIQPGDRIAQLVLCPVAPATPLDVEVLDDTARGAGGFGHTGEA